jgi:hypothetical protein
LHAVSNPVSQIGKKDHEEASRWLLERFEDMMSKPWMRDDVDMEREIIQLIPDHFSPCSICNVLDMNDPDLEPGGTMRWSPALL